MVKYKYKFISALLFFEYEYIFVTIPDVACVYCLLYIVRLNTVTVVRVEVGHSWLIRIIK